MSSVTVSSTSRLFVRLTSQRRYYNASPTQGSGTLADLVLQPQPILKTDEGITRIRKHGNKALPISSLLNFREDEEQSSHKPEPQPEHFSDFQQKLANNPFAQALATPIRQCNLTQARLPTHFLLPVSTVISRTTTHPERPPRVTANLRLGSRSQFPGEEVLNGHAYIIGSQDLVSNLGKKTKWQFLASERQKKLMGKLTQKNWQGWKFVKEHWVWSEGEGERAREMLEGEIVGGVRAVTRRQEQLGQTATNKNGMSIVIWASGLDWGQPKGASEGAESAVCDLRSVLSPVSLQALVGEIPRLVEGVRISPDAEATKLQLAFSRMRMYLGLSDD